MKKLQDLKIQLPKVIPLKEVKKPPHELAAIVTEIIKVVGEHPRYGFKYWLRIVKSSKKSYSEVMGILKELENLPSKYPKGAVLTNKLKLCRKKNISKS